ncbi:hypothetical protein ACFVT5_40515 [Streptomyces sp. NPDC058001]|uniref:hypothetical protein n=1 Tax=Streptomyces sp. NPDC058001 TaxID=3346300 RepID=UPI0036E24C28
MGHQALQPGRGGELDGSGGTTHELNWRTRAADHQVVHDHIEEYGEQGEQSAQRLFTRAFAATAQRMSGLGHLDIGHTPWGQA